MELRAWAKQLTESERRENARLAATIVKAILVLIPPMASASNGRPTLAIATTAKQKTKAVSA